MSGILAIARKKATQIGRRFQRIPFEDCYEAVEDGRNLPQFPGIYAFKHREGRLLYIGKSLNIQKRFKPGHEVFIRAFFAGYSVEDIRIVVSTINAESLPILKVMEAIIIFSLTPEFNRHIPTIVELSNMATTVQPFSLPQDVELTDLMPSEVVKAIKDYAAEYRITPNQVIELAIAQFLDLEGVFLSEYHHTESIAELKNKITLLQAKLDGLEQSQAPS